MQRGPPKVVNHSDGGAIGHEGDDTLMLSSGGSIVQWGAAKLVLQIDVTSLANHQVNTLDVPGREGRDGGREEGRQKLDGGGNERVTFTNPPQAAAWRQVRFSSSNSVIKR